MSRLINFMMVICVGLSTTATSCSAEGANQTNRLRGKKKKEQPSIQASDVPTPDGQRLRSIAPADGSFPMLVGGSISASEFGTEAEVILNREFAYVTPANDFKQSGIHPEPGEWKWKNSDLWIPQIEEHDQIMRLHSPISPQCSRWIKADERTGDEMRPVMQEFLTELCKRYNGNPRIRWMDVVNETVSRDGTWFGPREGTEKWENPWVKMGVDARTPLKVPVYIPEAFAVAGKHAPDIKLIYNQHGSMEKAMWRRVTATVLYLRQKGLRVDGIGWQAHINTGFEKEGDNIKNLHSLISWCHRHQLEFHVTENTVWAKPDEVTMEDQAITFGAIVSALLEHTDEGVVTWNAWQMRDGDTQKEGVAACMFDERGRPKAAYDTVQKLLLDAR